MVKFTLLLSCMPGGAKPGEYSFAKVLYDYPFWLWVEIGEYKKASDSLQKISMKKQNNLHYNFQFKNF